MKIVCDQHLSQCNINYTTHPTFIIACIHAKYWSVPNEIYSQWIWLLSRMQRARACTRWVNFAWKQDHTLLCPPTGYFVVKFHEIYPSIGEMRIHFVYRPTADFGMRVVAPVWREKTRPYTSFSHGSDLCGEILWNITKYLRQSNTLCIFLVHWCQPLD